MARTTYGLAFFLLNVFLKGVDRVVCKKKIVYEVEGNGKCIGLAERCMKSIASLIEELMRKR